MTVFGPRGLFCALVAVSAVVLLGPLPTALALDGASPLQYNTFNGWKAFELVTQGNTISSVADPGYSAGGTMTRGNFDGIGTYLSGDTLSIMLNHETGGAAISRIQADLPSLKQMIARQIDNGVTPAPSSIVTGIGYAYDAVFDSTYHAILNPNPVASGTVAVGNWGNANLNRFCSGTSYLPNSFGPSRGFVDPIYMTGEEESGGLFYAIDQASANRGMWQVAATGTGSWENAALVDTGNTTHVAMILMSDVGAPSSDYIRMYVGKKGVDSNADGSVDFLERNGLRGGSVYYFDPDAGFSASDLPNSKITGLWTTTGTAGVDLREDKLEDVATNPMNGQQVAFADQTDGVFRMDLSFAFVGDNLDLANSPVTIDSIYARNAANIDAPDNLDWTCNNLLFIQEDGSNNDMWQLNPDGTGLVRIGQGKAAETSGVVDVSSELGYAPGSILLSSVQGGTGQLAVFIAPTASLAGDANNDGFIDGGDYTIWADNFLQTGQAYAEGDYNCDGIVDGGDYTIWADNYSPAFAFATPEPSSLSLGALGLIGLLGVSRRRLSRDRSFTS